MRNVKRIFCALLCMAMLTGCNATTATQKVKSETQAFTDEEVLANRVTLSESEKANYVYNYVSNAVKLDAKSLVDIDAEDKSAITLSLSKIDKVLRTGVMEYDAYESPVISSDLANYMLMKFAETPYSWDISDTKIYGMDAATRLYVVDVVYKTTGKKKTILPESTIVSGDPYKAEKEKKRYNDYTLYLSNKQAGKTEYASTLLADFTRVWGNPQDVIESQNNYSLLERLAGGKTSSGSTSTSSSSTTSTSPSTGTDTPTTAVSGATSELGVYGYTDSLSNLSDFPSDGATMTFRMIFGYNYNLDEATDIVLKSVYLYDYDTGVDDKYIDSLRSEELSGIDIIEPIIRRFFYSYNTCVDEANHDGLYTLFDNYGKYDKMYIDYFSYTYHKYGSYLYDILSRDGNTIKVLVTSNKKERARNSVTSQPSYRESTLYTLKIDNNSKLRIVDRTLLSTKIMGEPISVIEGMTSVSEQLHFAEGYFTDTNQKKVNTVLKNFMNLELTKIFDSSAFSNCIDIGIATTQLENLRTTVNSIEGDEIIVWVQDYTSKSNSYVSINLREVYLKSGNEVGYDTESTIDMINRGGEWFVISYNRRVSTKVRASSVKDNECFEHLKVVDGKVKSVKRDLTIVDNSVTSE